MLEKEREDEGTEQGCKKKKKRTSKQQSRTGRAERFALWRLESDRGANGVASDDGPTGECWLCRWSGTNGAGEGMQLPALEERYCATGQGSLTQSQDGGLEGMEGGTQCRERQPC